MEQQQDIVILISDEEDECTAAFNDSVVVVETCVGNIDSNVTGEIVDDDLSITFTKKATVLPHARYDCCANLFSPNENETCKPVEKNVAFCEQCFCYICDKLASECEVWKTPGICHCNAHKQSAFWKEKRNKTILGFLHVFNFDVLEVDADLRRAEGHLLKFEEGLSVEYSTFLKGVKTKVVACDCYCHTADSDATACKKCKSRHAELYNYLNVYDFVSKFLDDAEKEKPKSAAVMLLGAAKHFIVHARPIGLPSEKNPKADVSDAIPLLLLRVTNTLKTLMVTFEFSASFLKKLQGFFKSLPLPVKCKWLVNSLNVLPWDDPLLTAVLKGQNITGERYQRGKKEVLFETVLVMEARVEKLKKQNRYRELARYLKVVRSDSRARLQVMRDQIPLYLCKAGEHYTALQSFFSTTPEICCTACRLTPSQFAVYLKILSTGKMPIGDDPFRSTQWENVQDAQLSKKHVIRCALRVLHSNTALFMDPESWVNLIKTACSKTMALDGTLTCAPFPVPVAMFQMAARATTSAILLEVSKSADGQIQIPKSFLMQYPDQALLMLVTQALVHRIIHSRMVNALNVVMAFKENAWAAKWFISGLSPRQDVLMVFFNVLLGDLYKAKSAPHCRKWDPSDHAFVGDFLFFYLLYPQSTLYANRSHLLDDLLMHWNEQEFPWQYYLRSFLQQNASWGLELTPDTCRFLEVIKSQPF